MSVLKEVKLVKVCSLCIKQIVRSENTTFNYKTLLNNKYLTNLDITIIRDINITF